MDEQPKKSRGSPLSETAIRTLLDGLLDARFRALEGRLLRAIESVGESNESPTHSETEREAELERMLTIADLAELLKCGERTLYRWVQEGKVPPPHRIGGSTIRWYGPDVRRWLEDRKREERA